MDLSQYVALIDGKLDELKAPAATLSVSAPLSEQYHQPPPKQIRRLEDAGYTFKFDTDDELWKDQKTCLISLPHAAPDRFIVRLAVDVSQGMIIIYEAWNRYHDTIKTMKLRDMIMSVWTLKAEQDATTLKWIKYSNVVEFNTMIALDEIYDKIFPRGQDDLYIPETGGIRKTRQAYCKLMINSPFAAGAKKMLREYFTEKGTVNAFFISKSDAGLRSLFIFMGSSAHSSDQSKDLNESSEERSESYSDLGGGTLYNSLQRLRRRLSSRLLEEDWVLLGPDNWADNDTLDGDWVIVGPDD
ncbi:hypothetical protein N0V93_008825 [Gnomoniopsis smithogilvyi]|uniref:Uncharacterized protein n=1 Tax=Gnomoniopsis smithogilvyi TaxID=1191159 RepID=A0A9W9CV52_9PEZI|nr:hypothetical protein N0V93_008825 [Gnomoniopsis smithogilvyi]